MCRKNPQQPAMHVGSVAAGPQQAALPPAQVETPDKETRARPVPIHRSEPSTAPGLPRSRADVTGSPRASPRSCLDTGTSPASASSLRSPLERIEQLLELLINKARCDFAAWEPGLTLCNTCMRCQDTTVLLPPARGPVRCSSDATSYCYQELITSTLLAGRGARIGTGGAWSCPECSEGEHGPSGSAAACWLG
jgi:hypothetical protein